MANDIEIKVPVTLDFDALSAKFDALKNQIESKPIDMRPNADLDEFFGNIKTQAAQTQKQIESLNASVKNMGRSAASLNTSSGMNMAALGASAYRPGSMNMSALSAFSGTSYRQIPPLPDKDRQYSDVFGSYQSRNESASRANLYGGFDNRRMQSELADGTAKKQIATTLKAEESLRKLRIESDKLTQQYRKMEYQQRYGRAGNAMQLIDDNKEAIQRSARAAMTGLGIGVAAVTALTTRGFAGTSEGYRLGNEVTFLSRELAGVMKPVVSALTNAARSVRQKMETLTVTQQDNLMKGGLAAFGAFGGMKAGAMLGGRFGLIGAGVGAATGAAVGEAITSNQKIKQGYDEFKSKIAGIEDPAERMKELEKQYLISKGRMRSDGTKLGIFESTLPNNHTAEKDTGYWNLRREMQKEMSVMKYKEYSVGKDGKSVYQGTFSADGKNTPDQSNPDRRKVLLTDGVGFGGAGSTYEALATESARIFAAEFEKLNATIEKVGDKAVNAMKD